MTETLLYGLLVGANYALLGLGYTLVFGVMRLLTLAHGQVFMAAGLVALVLSTSGTPIWLAATYAIVVGALLSALTDYVSFRPTGYDRPVAAAVSTIGYALVIEQRRAAGPRVVDGVCRPRSACPTPTSSSGGSSSRSSTWSAWCLPPWCWWPPTGSCVAPGGERRCEPSPATRRWWDCSGSRSGG